MCKLAGQVTDLFATDSKGVVECVSTLVVKYIIVKIKAWSAKVHFNLCYGNHSCSVISWNSYCALYL